MFSQRGGTRSYRFVYVSVCTYTVTRKRVKRVHVYVNTFTCSPDNRVLQHRWATQDGTRLCSFSLLKKQSKAVTSDCETPIFRARGCAFSELPTHYWILYYYTVYYVPYCILHTSAKIIFARGAFAPVPQSQKWLSGLTGFVRTFLTFVRWFVIAPVACLQRIVSFWSQLDCWLGRSVHKSCWERNFII